MIDPCKGRVRTSATRLVVLLCALGCGSAYADESPTDRLKTLNREALASYASSDFDSAKVSLLEAIGVGTKAALSDSPMMARTYVHLAAVYLNGYKDRGHALRYLMTALKIRSDIELTEAVATPALKDVFALAQAEAKRNAAAAAKAPPVVGAAPAPVAKPAPAPVAERPAPVAKPAPVVEKPAPVVKPAPAPVAKPAPVVEKPASAPAPKAPAAAPAPVVAQAPKPKPQPKAKVEKKRVGPEEPDLPASIPQALYCPNVDEAPPRAQMLLRCVAQPGVRMARVLLFYRAPGKEDFTAVPMVKSPKGWYSGVVPADVVTAKSLQYYFEARDGSDKAVADNGRNDSPNLMIIRAGVPPVGQGAAGLRVSRRGDGDAASAEDNPLSHIEAEKVRELEEAGHHMREAKALWIGFGVGSGYGWHPSTKLEYHNKLSVGAGFTPAGLLHFIPEVGYQVTSSLAISLAVRYQYVPSSGSGDVTVGAPKTSAVAALVRVFQFFGEGNTQPFVSGMLGGGQGVRLVVSPKPDMGLISSDTVRGGPLLVGAGGGILYHLSPHAAIVAELKLTLGAGDLAAVFDLTTGVQIGF